MTMLCTTISNAYDVWGRTTRKDVRRSQRVETWKTVIVGLIVIANSEHTELTHTWCSQEFRDREGNASAKHKSP